MNIRRRILLLLCTIMICMIGGLLFWQNSEARRIRSLLTNREQSQERNISKIMQLRGEGMETIGGDYTFWDEMVAFIGSRNSKWATNELNPALDTFAIDGIWVFNLKMELVHGITGRKLVENVPFPIPTDQIPAVLGTANSCHFYTYTPLGLFELRGSTVHPSGERLRSRQKFGYFFTARLWGPDLIKQLEEITDSKITIEKSDVATKIEKRLLEQTNLVESTIHITLPMKDGEDRVIARLHAVSFEPTLRLFQSSQAAMSRAIIFLSVLVFVLLSGTLFLWVYRPLDRLSDSLKSNSIEPIVPVARLKTEFGELARLVHQSFAQTESLKAEVEQRKSAEQGLQRAAELATIARQEAESKSALLELQTFDLEQANRAAHEAGVAKAQFFQNMSHEIRTPMNGIVGLANLMLDTPLNEEQRDYATTIQKSTLSLLELIKDILDYSSMESGKFALKESPFALRDLVDDVVAIIAPMTREKGLALNAVVNVDVPDSLLGDGERVRQVITNLMGNAVKFTPDGEIRLEASLRSRTETQALLEIRVIDSGIGIPAEKLNLIFERFTQVDGSATRKYGGTGLGLAIAREVVDLMGGDLSVTSEVGKGSQFVTVLPLKIDLGERAATAENPASGPSTINYSRLKLTSGDDAEFEHELVSLFLLTLREHIDKLEVLLSDDSSGSLLETATTLTNSGQTLGADALTEAAQRASHLPSGIPAEELRSAVLTLKETAEATFEAYEALALRPAA